jgi:hypothetical protein
MKSISTIHGAEHNHDVTWHELVELEPELLQLLWWARLAGTACRNRWDIDRAFSPLRNDLAGLIGFQGKHSKHPILGTAGAYAVAHWKLYEAIAALVPTVAATKAEEPETPQRVTSCSPVSSPGGGE